jgi:hypothetical protein
MRRVHIWMQKMSNALGNFTWFLRVTDVGPDSYRDPCI